jgi:hypothetical protein
MSEPMSNAGFKLIEELQDFVLLLVSPDAVW